eukprot:TRINITY_DN8996_c0_g1_i3.p4 TRINITY_DN8996_c0_g1~~TRINITY_DN8996_c0_g1_i3.p4  ORF type:complete len:145 (+),score=23.08 TRINITY_DN8996_c0_g1_i3:144-578(+)
MIRRPPRSTQGVSSAASDVYKRQVHGYIKTTLPAVNTNSLVIALNSPWGAGKTSFINMWMNKFKKTPKKYNIITYNAWENDDCPEAIVPLICSFNQLAISDPEKKEELKGKIISALKILGPRVINSVAWGDVPYRRKRDNRSLQ